MLLLLVLLPMVSASLVWHNVESELKQSIPTKNGVLDWEAILGPDPRAYLGFIATVDYDKKEGINVNGAKEHFVLTEDDYYVSVFELTPLPECAGKDKGPLIWWHGVLLGANSAILLGKDSQIYAYLQQCYHVYVPNSRGSRYSQMHKTLDPKTDSKFWAYGLKEMSWDAKAVIDFVLAQTGAKSLVYVGHGQGCTILIVLRAREPKYNDLISVAFCESVMCWLYDSRTLLLTADQVLGPGVDVLASFGYHGDTFNLFSYRGLLSEEATVLCTTTTTTYPGCLSVAYTFFGYDGDEIPQSAMRNLCGKEPSGIGSQLFAEYSKIKNKGFVDENGDEYPLHEITGEWRFLFSDNDYVNGLKDGEELLKAMYNAKFEVCVLDDDKFTYLDHVVGTHSPSYVTNWVLSYLGTGTATCKGTVVKAPNTKLVS